LIETTEFHALKADTCLAIGRLRGLFRMLSVVAQSDHDIDNETLAAVCDSGLVAADDAQRALERLVARVF
jgi:hypothetical protein